MQNIGLVSGAVQLIVSLVLGLVVAIVAFRSFTRMHRELDEMEALRENNVAMAIVLASMVIGTGLVVVQALGPAVSTMQTTLYNGITFLTGLAFVGMTLGFLLLAMFIAIVGIGVATKVFLWLTDEIDEMAEVKKNNIAVAITLASVIILMSMFLAQGSQTFLTSLVPYPAIESIQVMGK
tara:strand:- start:21 stop:560 length:540 start_codon:yes stop_codon:yes gene_type:complete